MQIKSLGHCGCQCIPSHWGAPQPRPLWDVRHLLPDRPFFCLWKCMLDTIVTTYGIANLSVCLNKLKTLWRMALFSLPIFTSSLLPSPRNKETCRKNIVQSVIFFYHSNPFPQPVFACHREPLWTLKGLIGFTPK